MSPQKQKNAIEIPPAQGRLGVLLVGLGAVSTTFIAGVEAIKRGLAEPIGSLTQMGTIRLGKRTDNRVPMIRDFVPLAALEDLVFGAWDIFEEDAYEAALHAGVLERELVTQLKTELQAVKPMKAVFDQRYVKRLNGTHVKSGKNKMELAEQLVQDIESSRRTMSVTGWYWSGAPQLRSSSSHQKTIRTFSLLSGRLSRTKTRSLPR